MTIGGNYNHTDILYLALHLHAYILIMNYTHNEYVDMLMCLGAANGVAAIAVRDYAQRFPNRRHPNTNVIRRVEQRLRETGQINHNPVNLGRPRTVRNPDMEENILVSIQNSPGRSVRSLAREFNVDVRTVHDILREEHYHPYRYSMVQSLLPGDAAPRLQFCQWLLEQHQANPQFISHVLWSDEATFSREGVFNRNNNHIWAIENPNAVRRRTFQQRFKLNVWAGIVGEHIIGPHILPQTLNARNYLEFLQQDFVNLMEDVPLNVRHNMWFQQDGAPAHFGRPVRIWLNENFPGRWIGSGAPISWQARSPDLTPLDFFYGDTLKIKCTPLK